MIKYYKKAVITPSVVIVSGYIVFAFYDELNSVFLKASEYNGKNIAELKNIIALTKSYQDEIKKLKIKIDNVDQIVYLELKKKNSEKSKTT